MDRSPRQVSSAETPSRALRVPGIARYQRRLLARIRGMMGPEARQALESADVLQSVYRATVEKLRAGALAGERLLPWMTEVARHKIVDEVRRRREQLLGDDGHELAAPEDGSLPSRICARERQRALSAALAGLRPEARRVIALRGEGRSWRDVGHVTGRSEEAARKLYHRALIELGRALEREEPGPAARG